MIDPLDTVIVQYGNSERILALVKLMNDKLDPRAALQAVVEFCWNVNTAQAWGLDIIGRIVRVSRNLKVAGDVAYFGFSEMPEAEPFSIESFYAGVPATDTYELGDEAFRTLIKFKAMSNISDSSIPSLNRMLSLMFRDRGRVFVSDTLGMSLIYHFEFELTPAEVSIITNSGAVPQPAGVLTLATTVDPTETFGFSEAGDWLPFDDGVFFNYDSFLTVAPAGVN